MKKIYIFFHHFTFYILAISIAFVFLLSQNYLVAALAQKYLKEYGVEYTKVEGTLLEGVILYDLKYTDAISVKKLQVQYNLLTLLRPTPKISKIKADRLYLDVGKLPSYDANATETSIMSFIISNIELKNAKVLVENETLEFNLKGKGFYYHDRIDVDKLSVDFKSSYANALIKGRITSNKFIGDSSVQINENISKEYLSFLSGIPKTLHVKIEATTQTALLSTNLDKLTLRDDENLSINDANINMTYFVNDNSFEADANYKTAYLSYEANINQKLLFTTESKYKSSLDAIITKQPIELPFKSIHADIFGDIDNMKANIKAGTLDFEISSKDYNYFIIQGQSDNLALSFLDSLPEELKKDIVSFKTNAYMYISPFSVKGKINIDDTYFKTDGEFELHKTDGLYEAILYPKLENSFYKTYPVKLFSPIKIKYENNIQGDKLNLDANLFHVALSKKESKLDGFGTLGSSTFTLLGEVNQNTGTQVDISTKVPSIKKLLSELQLSSKDSKITHDGEAEIYSTLNFGEKFSMKNNIRMPRYSLKPDSKKRYLVEDIFISTTYMNKELTINKYDAKFMEQKLYSDKPSTLLIDENGNVVIKEFWLYDSLLTTGLVNTTKKEVHVNLKSDKFSYSYDDIDITTKVDLNASIDSSGKQKIEGNIALLDAAINKQPILFPFKNIDAYMLGDENSIKINIQTGPLDFYITSKDYEYFIIQAEKDKLSLSFIDSLPEQLKKDKVSFKAKASMHTSPFSLQGTITADDEYFKTEGNFEVRKSYELYKATLHPKLENKFYKNYPVKLFSPINIIYKNDSKSEKINIDANLLSATLFKKDDTVHGTGNIGSSTFTLSTKPAKNQDTEITLSTKTPSVKKLLSELHVSSPNDTTVYDAEADIKSTIILGNDISMKNDIRIPWLTVTMDSENIYLAENISLSTEYTDKKLTIKSYSAKYMEQKFYSDKLSTLLIDENGNIVIKEFWLYDNLLSTGFIDTTTNEASIHLKSDKFTYHDKDANLSAKADIHASIDSNGKQKIEGSVTLLDGVITYIPPQDYTVTDKDIIIIQDIKADYTSNRFIHVNINSLLPITYKNKDINIHFTPDIVIYQELGMPLKLLGMATINDGEITTGDKEFVLDKSEIYFTGEDPINPQLNLNLHYYTLDYIDIEIFITNTLSSPVIIFSSKPAMSQNDIMSYILFGEPASSLFESSDGSTKASVSSLLLGTGLKQIFNDTAGIKVDTLNILTNKEGTLGYEIGTRFNKNIRIIYKNDTASSVIVQYSLSKSIRVEVDAQETGQGVNIIYVKDF